MQPIHEDALDCYCLHCLAPLSEGLEACPSCSAPLMGNGAFHVVRGPRPSPLFAEIFASPPTRSD